MKYWLVIAALALSVSFASAQERMKIGYIDVQRVIAESQSGKRAKDRFQAQVKKAEADVQKERQEVERLKSDLDKKGPLLKEEERRNMEADLQKRSVILQRSYERLPTRSSTKGKRNDVRIFSRRSSRSSTKLVKLKNSRLSLSAHRLFTATRESILPAKSSKPTIAGRKNKW